MTSVSELRTDTGDLGSRVDVFEVKRKVAEGLSREMDAYEKANSRPMPDVEQRAHVDHLTKSALRESRDKALQTGGAELSREDVERLCEEVHHFVFAAGQLQPLLDDPDVQEIRCFGCDNVWLKLTDGRLVRGPAVFRTDADLVEQVQKFAGDSGMGERRYDHSSPQLDFALEDHRGFAVRGFSLRPQLILRRHDFTRLATLEQQVEAGMLSAPLAAFLRAAVRARKNILVSGGTDTGKTTNLRALCNEVPADEHKVTIEDTLELGLHKFPALHPQLSVWWTQDANLEGKGRIDQFQLGRAALRASPDRVILGESRGREAKQLVFAMTQGNDGSMSTVHASSSAGALERLVTLLTEDGSSETWAMRAVAQAVHLVVHLEKLTRPGRAPLRAVTSVREVTGFEGGQIRSTEIFGPGPDGRAVPRPGAMTEKLLTDLEHAGLDPACLDGADEW